MTERAPKAPLDHQVLLRRLDPRDLPGTFGRQVRVAPGGWAVVRHRDKVDLLPEGTHRVWGFLSPQAPRDLVLVESSSFTLHPVVGGLISGDDQLLEAEFLLKARVSDPQAFYRLLGSGQDTLTVGDLEGWIASKAHGVLARAARQHTAQDLCHVDAVADKVAAELRGFLQTVLSSWGLEVDALRYLTFRRGEDAVKVARAMRRLREELRDESLRARLRAIQDLEEFWDAVEQIVHERDLRRRLRKEELEAIKEEIQAPSSDAGDQGPSLTLTAALQEREAAQKRQVLGRWDALLARLGIVKQDDVCEPSPVDRLERWVVILRAVGTIVFFGTTLLALLMPNIFRDPRIPQLITAVVGLTLGVLAFVSAFWFKRRADTERVREQQRRALARLSPERRRQVERLVRERIVATLRRVEANLQEAWVKAYRGQHQDLAQPLRAIAHKVARLRAEVEGLHYDRSALLTQNPIAAEQILPWLDLDERLLEQAEELGEVSQNLYQNVVGEQWDAVEHLGQQLDMGLQNLRSRLAQRDTLLKGV